MDNVKNNEYYIAKIARLKAQVFAQRLIRIRKLISTG